MRRRALIGKMQNRISAPRERGYFDRWPRHFQAAVMAGELAERSFFAFFLRPQVAFERDFGIRRYLQRHSLTWHNLKRLSSKSSSHRQLVGAEGERTGRRHDQARIDANRDSNRKGFGGSFAELQHEIGVRAGQNSESPPVMNLVSIDADVSDPGHRISRMMTAKREISAAVEAVEARRGKIEDVNVISLQNNLVTTGAVDENRRQRLADPPIPLAMNVLLIALHRQGVTLARGQGVYENRHVLAAGALKQQRRTAASQARDTDRTQLLIQIDRHAHARKLAFSVEQLNKFSQARKTHDDLLGFE